MMCSFGLVSVVCRIRRHCRFDEANIALKSLDKNPSTHHAGSRKGDGLCALKRCCGPAL
jgi:hypothetical protein